MRKLRIAYAAILAGAFSTQAWGQQGPLTLPNVSTDVTLDGTSYPDAGAGTYRTTFNNAPAGGPPTSGTMSASVHTGPSPLISVDVTGCCSDYSPGQARIDLTYYAVLVGPNLGPVPMELFESLVSSSTGTDSAGWAMITATGATTGQEIVNSSSCCAGSSDDVNPGGSSAGVLRFVAYPGRQMTIEMALNAWVANGHSSSSADPYLAIDPSFASTDPNYSTDYSLAFSPGVVNSPGAPVSGVPEPSTWALMLLGFCAIGFAVRGNRKFKAAAQLA